MPVSRELETRSRLATADRLFGRKRTIAHTVKEDNLKGHYPRFGCVPMAWH